VIVEQPNVGTLATKAESSISGQKNNLVLQLASADLKGMKPQPSSKDLEQAARAAHAFWETQPVSQFKGERGSQDLSEGPIQPPQKVEEVRQESYKLPSAYEWCTCDVNDANVSCTGKDQKRLFGLSVPQTGMFSLT
jgi:hypothetical protein